MSLMYAVAEFLTDIIMELLGLKKYDKKRRKK